MKINDFQNKLAGILKVVTFAIFAFLCIWLVASSQILPSERNSRDYMVQTFDDNWILEQSNGTKTEVEFPGTYAISDGESAVFSKTVPQNTADNTWLCFRTSKQDMYIYVDDSLRGSYSTAETRPFGVSSASTYLFIPLNSSDAEKTISVEVTSDSAYNGVMRSVLYGDKLGIAYKLFKENMFPLISAIILTIIGIASIIIQAVFYLKNKQTSHLAFLGIFSLIMALWLLTQSKIRQFFFENVSLASAFSQFILLLFPIVAALFISYLQSKRYQKFYLAFSIAAFIHFVICAAVIVTGTIDQTETSITLYILFAVLIVLIIVTVCADIKKGLAYDYHVVICGLGAFLFFGIVQILLSFDKETAIRGQLLSTGLILLILSACVQTIIKIVQEQKTLKTIAEHSAARITELSLQSMTALIHALEAKDKYTKGHSARVAEYSKLLAEHLGMTAQEQNDIYFMGLLHDIGKIGIPDFLMTKPEPLTDEDRRTIQQHPVTGYEILKNFNVIKGIEQSARWHHERIDGRGYPDGLHGDNIPFAVKIISVADAYDAMSSQRTYRRPLTREFIISELEAGKGTQFDIVIAEKMLELLEKGIIE